MLCAQALGPSLPFFQLKGHIGDPFLPLILFQPLWLLVHYYISSHSASLGILSVLFDKYPVQGTLLRTLLDSCCYHF